MSIDVDLATVLLGQVWKRLHSFCHTFSVASANSDPYYRNAIEYDTFH